MAAPDVVPLAQEVHDQLGALSKPDTDDTGWALLCLLDVLLFAAQPIEDLARDRGDRTGWSDALDPDLAPGVLLRWLGQMAGVRVTRGVETDPGWVEAARAEVRNAAGFRRGNTAAMIGAARATLSDPGSGIVYVNERAGGAYLLGVATLDSQTPDAAATEAAIRTQKPAGLVLSYDSIPGGDYASLKGTHTDYADVFATFTDYSDVLTDPTQT